MTRSLGDAPERLCDEYRHARTRMRSLVHDLDVVSARRRVPACPDWTVADLLAHVAGLAVGYGTGRVPDTERDAWRDGLVTARRGRELRELVEEWDRAGPTMESAIADEPQRLWPLVYDVIAHEHDLRGALDRPGDRDGAAVRLALDLGLRITASDLARHDLGTLQVLAGGVEHVAGDGPPVLTLEASVFDAFRLLGSRRTRAEMEAAAFTGDLHRILPALVHMRLPTHTLGE